MMSFMSLISVLPRDRVFVLIFLVHLIIIWDEAIVSSSCSRIQAIAY